ncbi:hypothetical protein Gorai_009204, partial [Gossypium raimondii]|nr:hypothetical protein [Gossypium raimondii]
FLVSRKSLYGYCNQWVFCSGRFKHRNSEGYEESSSSKDDLIDTKGIEDDGRKKSHASFKDTLLGSLKNKSTNLIKDDIELREGDTITKMVNGIHSVRCLDRVHKEMEKCMVLTMVIKLLGCCISFNALLNKICALWKPNNTIQLMDLGKVYYLVRFQYKEDYDTILTKAPSDPRYSSAMYTMSILNAIGNVFGRVD